MEIKDTGNGETSIPTPAEMERGPLNAAYHRHRITWTVAGYVAERMAMKDAEPGKEFICALTRAKLLAEKLGTNDPDDATARSIAEMAVAVHEARAESILRRNWDVVNELARQLETRRRLDGPDLASILSGLACDDGA